MYMDETKKIVIISDGTGKTARRLMDAVLAQYAHQDIEYSLVKTYSEVRAKKQINRILQEIDDDFLVVFSIISKTLNDYFCEKLSKRNILHLNVLKPMISTLSKFLGVHPDYQPGILQKIDDRYYKKIDAIGFTVEHDDGLGQFIGEADIVLVGLSRTCKTPISMYLACNYGMKVANIPIVSNPALTDNLLNKLQPLNRKNIFGLLMQPEILARIREERSHYLAPETKQTTVELYHDIREVRSELRFCRDLFSAQGWHTIDVTRRAIEEISLEILTKLGHAPNDI